MQLTKLEKAVLAWIAERNAPLTRKLECAQVVQREHTGHGSYTYLQSTDADWDRPPVDGPHISSPELHNGGSSILWLSRGEPQCLEVFGYGDPFPEDPAEFTLSDEGYTFIAGT